VPRPESTAVNRGPTGLAYGFGSLPLVPEESRLRRSPTTAHSAKPVRCFYRWRSGPAPRYGGGTAAQRKEQQWRI